MAIKAVKTKKCAVCKQNFVPMSTLAKVCSPKCAIELTQRAKKRRLEQGKREQRRIDKARKQALETVPELTKKAQAAFNRYIRLRDKGKPCVSCGKPHDGNPNSFDAGHYRSVGSAPNLRFDENNVHGQCKHCNCYLSGNIVMYRQGLIERVGLQTVEAIECDNAPRHYSKDDLRELVRLYRQKAKGLEDGAEV